MMTPRVLAAPAIELAKTLASSVASACRDAVDDRGAAHVAVTGGSLLRHFGPALAGAAVDWSRLHVYFGDERAVPPTDPESNYNLARATWLDRVDVPAGRGYRLTAD